MSEPSTSSYPDLFDEYTPDILNAIDEAEASYEPIQAKATDLQPAVQLRKRHRSPSPKSEHPATLEQLTTEDGSSYMDDTSTYGASKFNGWGEYMRRKRAKLQIQNAEIPSDGDGGGGMADESSKFFEGLRIYINGYTTPSVQELRRLIIQHGGVFHPYLDRKSLVTHVITCSLTPAKMKEFQHMKLATPSWLTDSVEAGRLLPWTDYKYVAGNRLDQAEGRKTSQRVLDAFASQPTRQSTSVKPPRHVGSSSSLTSGATKERDHASTPIADDPVLKATTALAAAHVDDDGVGSSASGTSRPLAGDGLSYMDEDTYSASKFGGISDFMRRKRVKLQVQNAQIEDVLDSAQEKRSDIFKGLSLYINGYTDPPEHKLRELIVQHGGTYQAYMDQKSYITHIITSTLTAAKIREFARMKVVTPAWLVDSIAQGALLPWQAYIWKVEERAEEDYQGKVVPRPMLFKGTAGVKHSTGASAASRDSAVDAQAAPKVPATAPQTPKKPKALGSPHVSTPSTPNKALPVFVPRTPTTPKADHALYTTDPVSPDQAQRVPGYAMHDSNLAAQKAMKNVEWRKAHTSISEGFIEGYYKNSRLHHLSMWKAELRGLLQQAQEKAEHIVDKADVDEPEQSSQGDPSQSSIDIPAEADGDNICEKDTRAAAAIADSVSMRGAALALNPLVRKVKDASRSADSKRRVIMHCDFDCFFVSAGLVSRPQLKGKPVVVCHSQGAQGGNASTSEIASASYEAREFGIRGGMSLQQARQLCPGIITIPYEFETYKKYSLEFYTILMRYADDLQAVSVDEALIDVTSRIIDHAHSTSTTSEPAVDPALELANRIRSQVRAATNCEVSIGIAHNVMLARLANRRAKPAGALHIHPDEAEDFLAPLKLDDLHGFGYASAQKAQEKLGTTILGELRKRSKGTLCDALGKGTGDTVWKAIRGIDDKKLESDKPRKSVSCDINYGIRFEDNGQAEHFIYQMAEEVARRLDAIHMRGQSLTLKILKRHPEAPVEAPKFMGHGWCQQFTKQAALLRTTSEPKLIGDCAWRLLKSLAFDPKELRGIGIQIQKLQKVAQSVPDQGQGKLFFPPAAAMPINQAKQGQPPPAAPPTVVLPPSQNDEVIMIDVPDKAEAALKDANLPVPAVPVDLPSFSQVDRSVFDALPDDVRKELQAEYQRRSVSPLKEVAMKNIKTSIPAAPVDLPSFSQVDRSVFDALPDDVRKELEVEYKRRSASPLVAPIPPAPVNLGLRASPVKAPLFKLSVKGSNVKRITQALAPKNRGVRSPKNTTIFAKIDKGKQKQKIIFPTTSVANVTPDELRELDIDPDIFTMLPKDVQREQLAGARYARGLGGATVVFAEGKRKPLKPMTGFIKDPNAVRYIPPPPPHVYHPEPPFLKQISQGKKLFFTLAEDVQDLIEAWVDRFREQLPNDRDVEFFAKFLVQSMEGERSTDGGIHKAIGVLKWWLIVLRTHFGVWEHVQGDMPVDPEGRITSEMVGRSWWKAFREVKGRMDVVSRKRFGGNVSVR
ncbi:hypothetical protein PUNSTDRAFT_135458 [Punctularia strigosozonata HHB-11173 SS5]|uniref:uncharacterized protein n=1 Tax=Punctularia strigosozonata (strain HHB-11173) TaxID=741275 RepID=UPI00044178F4|nr:uncharacterized protein PUNSTDRAFT_135458 [Punctularia strigosozonata HHB-11173 SS5]EIN07940.1 hypothetical protein PUNSTDRAFT_135458 [Punctularia strigosozonata HHB-11173 SS5]